MRLTTKTESSNANTVTKDSSERKKNYATSGHTQTTENINVEFVTSDFSALITEKATKKLIPTLKNLSANLAINHSDEKTNTTDTASEKFVRPTK